MALPDYSALAGSGSMFMGEMNRRQQRQDRRQGRRAMRQGRRQARRNSGLPSMNPVNPVDPMEFDLEPLPPLEGNFRAPQNTANHPFFDPEADYIPQGATSASRLPGAGQPGSNPFNIYGTTESPEGFYYGILNQQGLGGLDARSQAAQGMYGQFARGYQSAKINNMELWFPEYMQMQDIPGLTQQLSDEQLGIDRSRYQGPLNWTLRG